MDKEKRKEYNRHHYLDNKEYYRDKCRESRLRYRAWWLEYRKQFSCSRCPENDHCCIVFHHIDSSNKTKCIGDLLRDRVAKQVIIDEIKKCIVLCSNCHKKEHYRLNCEKEN